ncbi:hypothetical protein [Flavobacterium sp.]|uniref:hypothetical protein n=1 Tax=Flavobacterium sp. TaxID=239 RepID=UPI003527D130
MKTLTTQNLKFIDNYLKKSEIIYDDIRMELTDHIASAVEEKMKLESIDFYDAFKSYMISNKKELLKKFSGSGFKSFEPIKNFGLFLLKPYLILFALFFYLGICFFQTTIDIEPFIYEFHHYWLLSMFYFVIIHLVYFNFIKKKRFYAIEQSFFVLTIIYYVFIFFSIPYQVEDYNFIFWTDTSILFFSIAFLFFYFNRIKKYYNNKHIWN